MWNCEQAQAQDTRTYPAAGIGAEVPRQTTISERLSRALSNLRDLNNGTDIIVCRVSGNGQKQECGNSPSVAQPSLDQLSCEIDVAVDALHYKLRTIAESVG